MAHAPATGILFALLAVPLGAPPAAADGTVIVTQAKALSGGVCPGDGPSYPIQLCGGTNYRLGSDLNVPADRNAFSLYSGTIDLGGYTISGGGTAKHVMEGGISGLTLRNGTITGFQGVVLSFTTLRSNARYWSIEDVTFTNNGGVADTTTDDNASGFEFRNNVVMSNGSGIACGDLCTVEGNIFAKNQGAAISIKSGTVLGNTIIGNGVGISGYSGDSPPPVGYGDNTIRGNTVQVKKAIPLAPNACSPAC